MLALSLIAYLAMNLVRIMQLSRVGKFAHRFSVRVDMECPFYFTNSFDSLISTVSSGSVVRQSSRSDCGWQYAG
jgi:hypothetical protein